MRHLPSKPGTEFRISYFRPGGAAICYSLSAVFIRPKDACIMYPRLDSCTDVPQTRAVHQARRSIVCGGSQCSTACDCKGGCGGTDREHFRGSEFGAEGTGTCANAARHGTSIGSVLRQNPAQTRKYRAPMTRLEHEFCPKFSNIWHQRISLNSLRA